MKITVDGVVYDVVKEKEIEVCAGCFVYLFYENKSISDCKQITGVDCVKEKVIFLKVPDSLKNCHNCKGFSEYRCSECKNYDKWELKE